MKRNATLPRKEIKLFEFPHNKVFSYQRDSLNFRNYEFNDTTLTREWAQLKYLISEIQFLNYFWSNEAYSNEHMKTPKMVYVSDKNNLTHLSVLMKMFPWFEYTFYLKPDTELMNPKEMKILPYEQFFEESEVKKWSKIADQYKNLFLVMNCQFEDPDRQVIDVSEELERMKNSEEYIEADESVKFEMVNNLKRDAFRIIELEQPFYNNLYKRQLLDVQKQIISKIMPAKCMTEISLPLTFEPTIEKSEDSNHLNFFEGLALRYAYQDPNEKTFPLIISDNIEERLWNVDEMFTAITLHNEKIRLYPYIPKGYGNLGDSKFINARIGLGKNFDGCILFETIKNYLFKFMPFSSIEKAIFQIEVLFEVINRILISLTPRGLNRLVPRKTSTK